MKASIISIGDELLIGDTVNTNASFIAQRLREWGILLQLIQTIGDDLEQMRALLKENLNKYDLVITTGGLGPTHDDVTKKAVCDVLDADLIEHTPTLDHVKSYFNKRGIPFTKSNYAQALIPEGAEVLQNNMGTAPGLWLPVNQSTLVVLPGVPREMKYLMEQRVGPRIKKDAPVQSSVRKVVYRRTAGIGESELSDNYLPELSTIVQPHGSVAYLPSTEGVSLRVTMEAPNKQEADQRLMPILDYIQEHAGAFIFTDSKDKSLSMAVGDRLKSNDQQLATAESCTGGLLGSTLTDVPGSSDYYVGGEITYSNDAKIRELGVPKQDLETHGAVSLPVAAQMAKAVALNNDVEIGVSTTGIAGPSGGSDEKPVGTVWFGFFARDKQGNVKEHFACKAQLTKDRSVNKERSVAIALEMVRRYLDEIQALPYGMKKQKVA